MKVLPLTSTKKSLHKEVKNPDDSKYRFVYHFLPHPHKRKRATLLSNPALTIYIILILILFSLFKITSKVAPGVLGYASNIKIEELLTLTNKKRRDTGLGSLNYNPALASAAEKKAKNMFEKGYWAHVAPDGTEPWAFVLAEKYDYSYAGENLAKNFSNSREVVEAWYNSPSHKENLLGENYDEVGFAVVNGVLDGYETTLVVQMFGRQRNPSLIASISEEAFVARSVKPNPTVSQPAATAPVHAPTFSFNILPETQGAQTFYIDMKSSVGILNVTFGLFLVSLLLLDIWYTKQKAIVKVSGHALAHIAFLIVVMVGFWISMSPGKILDGSKLEASACVKGKCK